MISTIVLICGVVASLALGVLVAYALCISMFAVFKMHARQMTASRTLSPKAAAPSLGTLPN